MSVGSPKAKDSRGKMGRRYKLKGTRRHFREPLDHPTCTVRQPRGLQSGRTGRNSEHYGEIITMATSR